MRRIKDHTFEKLEYIRKYIGAYLLATKRIPIKYYLDAFAGTGQCVLCNDSSCKSKGNKCNCGNGTIVDGSALIALKSALKFNKYYLFELGQGEIKELSNIINQEIDQSLIPLVDIVPGDCNKEIPSKLREFTRNASCLALLDPEGPELDWTTIVHLSKIKSMDLLILFPYDMSLARLVKDYKEKNDKFFGSKDWRAIHASAPTIAMRKRGILDHFLDNLKGLGFSDVTYKLIKSGYRSGNPLYHFILASRYPVATKIMNDIFDKPLDSQIKLLKF